MNPYARFNVFSVAFGFAYVGLWLSSEFYKIALFRYYPVLHAFRMDNLPAADAGPAILWYSWLLGAAAISLVVALLVPARTAEKMSTRWVWYLPMALLIGVLVYERRWFY